MLLFIYINLIDFDLKQFLVSFSKFPAFWNSLCLLGKRQLINKVYIFWYSKGYSTVWALGGCSDQVLLEIKCDIVVQSLKS